MSGSDPVKSRKQKAKIYEQKYSEIPRDFQARLDWMYDHYHITPEKADTIYQVRNQMVDTLQFSKEIRVILYEEPEGAHRPRARYVQKRNMTAMARQCPGFIQIYSLNAEDDRKYMKRLVTEQELLEVDYLINTPCMVRYEAYIRTPASFKAVDVYLAELGIIRPICKPDFDNLEKKYSDMYNGNVWLDDSLVIESSMSKYYSILPRVEISLRYLNMLYNKVQYDSISKRVDDASNVRYFERR
jgi:Holliday junction resolvase RusA-like endonuclease